MIMAALEQLLNIIESTKQIQATKLDENLKNQERLMEIMHKKNANSMSQLRKKLTTELKDAITSLFHSHLVPKI